MSDSRSIFVAPGAPTPVRGLARRDAYRVPRPLTPVDLRLDANEGARASELAGRPGPSAELLRRYPRAAELEQVLAERFGVAAEQVLVTAGADDALGRACLAYLDGGRELVLQTPAFEMLERYAGLAGARLRPVEERDGRYPIEGVLRAVRAAGEDLGVVAVVSPNNPTGAVASVEDLERVAGAAPNALVLCDLAYAEYAQVDLTEAALALPNAVVVRTFSKAWGLAAARVGYAIGPAPVIRALRAAGNPFAVGGPSLALAHARLEQGDASMRAHVRTVRYERERLAAQLRRLGARVAPSQANFVLAELGEAERARDLLAGLGIGVRAFPDRDELAGCLRIACPGDERDFERLTAALDAALAPRALLFDLDGVLADVSRSYRCAILETARSFGVTLTAEDVARATARGDANCDWRLTRDLLTERGVDATLEEVTGRFERLYQGGLWREETLELAPERLDALRDRYRLGIVTGRPARDAQRFLSTFGIGERFDAVVTRDQAPLKPDPAPVLLALERLGARSAWMFGDTPDDVRAARAAGVVPIGVLAPGTDDPDRTERSLLRSGAARVLDGLTGLEELLP